MATSNLKSLPAIVLLGFAAAFTLGSTIVLRGLTELGKSGGIAFKAKGPQAKQARIVDDFDRIEAGGVYEVDITFGSRPSLVIEAPKDLLPHLTSKVSGGTLSLGSDRDYNITDGARIRAHVVTRRLRGADVSGAGNIAINGMIHEANFDATARGAASLTLSSAKVDSFKLEASGASKTNIDSLGAKTLKIDASGSANCSIFGAVSSSSIKARGASNIKGKLTTNNAAVQTSGAAHATLRVIDSLTGEAGGASSISYSGNPAKVTKHTSGVGSINHSN